MSQKQHKTNKMTREQKAARIKAAEQRELRAQEKAEKAARMKKVFIVVVCVILVLALSIPTVALSMLSF